MKKSRFFLALLAIAGLVSCEETPDAPQPGAQVISEMTANISGPEGVDLSWAAGEKITVYDGKGKNTFTTTDGGNPATFTGEASGAAETIYAVSPASTEQIYSGYINLTVPTGQDGVVGGVDKDAALMTAFLSPVDAKVLDFKPVVGFAKITFKEADAVVSVELKSNNEEALTGQVRVGVFATPTIETRPNVQSSVTLTGNPLSGTYYIAVIPQTLNAGYTLTIVNEAEKRVAVATTEPVTFEMGKVVDLGTFENIEWLEPVNPNPTTVPSVKVVKTSFKDAEFNIVSDGDLEYFGGMSRRSNWRYHNEVLKVEGYTGNTAVNLFNNAAGRWWDPCIQSTALVPNTDYVYTAWGKSNTQYVYNGVFRMPEIGYDGTALGLGWSEIGGHPGDVARGEGSHGWAPNNEWTEQRIEFNSGNAFYCDVFCRIAGDAAGAGPLLPDGLDANITFDSFRLVPKNYEHMSMEYNGLEIVGAVKNATFDQIESLGKVTAWRNVDGKIAMCLSNLTVNGVHYDNVIALTDNEDLTTAELSISKMLKSGGKLLPFLEAEEGVISIVPNDAFVVGDKVYMHYYAKASQDPANAEVWTISYSGFAVSEDGGKTWTKCAKTWDGAGCFAQAGFYEKAGVLYMAGSKAGRATTDYWANMYVAKCDMSADFTDPANWEYWDAFKWVKGNEAASNVPICCLTVGPRSEPQLVYNEKFGRWMMILRSGNLKGLVFRDSEEIQGPYSGEKILTDDDLTGLSYCPSIIDQTTDGDLLMVVPQL